MAAAATFATAWASRSRLGVPETILAVVGVAVWLGVLPAEVTLALVVQ
jgi:hypothetical protein